MIYEWNSNLNYCLFEEEEKKYVRNFNYEKKTIWKIKFDETDE